MKNSIKIIVLFLFSYSVNPIFAQTLEGYLESKGGINICKASHASNDYLGGSYTINKNYVYIYLISKDNVFGGTINTNLRLVRSSNGLYFSDIIVDSDNDIVKPFEAFGLQVDLMKVLYNSIAPETYNKVRNLINETFNSNFEQWTGKMWALLAINLDYYEYLLKGY